VYIDLREVQKYTRVEPINLTYGEQIIEGLKNTFAAIGEFFKAFLKYFVIALPVLVILAVVAVIAGVIVRHSLRKRRAIRIQAAMPKVSEVLTPPETEERDKD
jgi:branched-subunit amino acid ABC-type transport system permease component